MRRSILSIITIVLLVTNLILTGIIMFVMVPALKDSNALITKVAQAINLEIKESGEIDPIKDCVTYDLDTKLTIALKKSGGRDHYAVIYPALLLNKNHDDYKTMKDTLTEKKAVITQHIEDVVKKYTADELQNNPEMVRQEILLDLQELYGSKFIVQVIFGTTTIQ